MLLFKELGKNIELIENKLPVKNSFDVIGRELRLGKKDAYLVFIDGFAKDDIMLWTLENLQNNSFKKVSDIRDFLKNNISYIEVEVFNDIKDLQKSVLSGAAAIILDGWDEGIILDVRSYPARGPQEPDLEKVTRGSRDGLVETIIFNTALIRRRVRDDNLIFEMKNVGIRSQTDVALGYIDDLVDKKLLDNVIKKIEEIEIDSLLMAEKSLEELLIKKKWYNPLPQAKFTERPDVVAAHLLEGHIAIIVDTSPSVMLLPTTFFHFTQHSEDYYQNPTAGTYIRWVRFTSIILSLLLTPIWLAILDNPGLLPDVLNFIIPGKEGNIPIFLQLIMLELGLDILRIASIHTPNTLSTSLGIIGGLMLSDLAISAGWFTTEAVLYMAIVGLCTFASPSIEFSNAIKIFRLFLLITTGFFGGYGFFIGLFIVLLIIYKTKTFSGIKYTWPLIPFNGNAFLNVILRKPIIEIKRNMKKQK